MTNENEVDCVKDHIADFLSRLEEDKFVKLLENKSTIYQYVEKLVNQTNDLLTAHSDNMSQESVMAAKSMIDEHNFLIKRSNPLTLDFRDFIESALNIVSRYEHKEGRPGF